MPAPPISALSQLKVLDPTLVERVRNQFLDQVQRNPQSFDPEDVEEVQRNDWQTQRFVLEAKLDQNKALEGMLEAFKWRNQHRVRHLKATDFPEIFYKTGYMCQVGHDVNGAKILYFRSNIHRKTGEWKEVMNQFFLYLIEQVDANNDGKGVALLMDCSGIGYANLDLDMLKFVVETFSKYYPKLFDAILVHELPFVLSYVFKLVQSWLPADDRKFFHTTSKKNIKQFVSKEQLPTFVAGGENRNWDIVPANESILSVGDFARVRNMPPGAGEKIDFLKQFVNK